MNKLPDFVDIEIVYTDKLHYDIKAFSHETGEEIQGVTDVIIDVKHPRKDTFNQWTEEEFTVNKEPVVAKATIRIYNTVSYVAMVKKVTTVKKEVVLFV